MSLRLSVKWDLSIQATVLLRCFNRTLLPGLHFNENSSRSTATTQDGMKRFAVRFPKYKRGGHVVKQIMTDPTYSKFNSKVDTTKNDFSPAVTVMPDHVTTMLIINILGIV